jgi:hypothetical protein
MYTLYGSNGSLNTFSDLTEVSDFLEDFFLVEENAEIEFELFDAFGEEYEIFSCGGEAGFFFNKL